MAAHARSGCATRSSEVPIDETRKMLGLNAAEFYNFDVEALQPIVDEIGPDA